MSTNREELIARILDLRDEQYGIGAWLVGYIEHCDLSLGGDVQEQIDHWKRAREQIKAAINQLQETA